MLANDNSEKLQIKIKIKIKKLEKANDKTQGKNKTD